MGVTIHFEGKLRSLEALNTIRFIAHKWAVEWGCPVIDLDSPWKRLERVVDEKDFDYEGPVVGIQLEPHPDAEPFILEFDDQLVVQEYCKTQFAPPEVHVSIVRVLREIEPLFEWMDVFDEGGFWESGSMESLREAFDQFVIARDEEVQKNPKLSGPFRHPSGRIIDLMETPEGTPNNG